MFHMFLGLVFVRHYHTRAEEHVFSLFLRVFLPFLVSGAGLISLCFVQEKYQTRTSQTFFHQVVVMSHDAGLVCD